MPNEINIRAERAIREKVFPGCVIGVVEKGGRRVVLPSGSLTHDPDAPPVREDTIYDMASVTKSIPVASLALLFIEQKTLHLSDKVTKYLPELKHDYGATIEDLLTYRVKGTQLSPLHDKTPEEILRVVFENGFDGPPERHLYTNAPAFLLGIILERAAGSTLDELAERHFFGPLGMKDTTFFPGDASRIPPTEFVRGREVRGVVHDESARVFSRARRAVGHAGLFSTAPDILNFLEALLQQKYGFTKPILEGAQQGLGWQKAEPWFMGTRYSPGAFGKTGFTGTSVAVDSARGVGLVILSNRTYPTRPPDAASPTSAISRFRADIADIVFSARG